jgi:putative PIN family toxin of toxin-antitoxin system
LTVPPAGEPVRVVLDTNVVVAALLWDGIPRQLLEALAADPFVTLASSPQLLAELDRVLVKPQLTERFRLLSLNSRQVIARYARLVTIVTPQSVARVVEADADDDHVLALAVAAKAAFIVSGDRAHLLPIGSYAGIAIITPREAMAVFHS